jgi:hypothetical protein
MAKEMVNCLYTEKDNRELPILLIRLAMKILKIHIYEKNSIEN